MFSIHLSMPLSRIVTQCTYVHMYLCNNTTTHPRLPHSLILLCVEPLLYPAMAEILPKKLTTVICMYVCTYTYAINSS